MRCKVGDLVVVVSCELFPQNIGRMGTITLPMENGLWWVNPAHRLWGRMPAPTLWGFLSGWKEVETCAPVSFLDEQLRPIRDPGDEAMDEMAGIHKEMSILRKLTSWV